MQAPQPHRPAAGVHIHTGAPTLVFVTVKTRHRDPWLATPPIHTALRTVWRQATHWLVGDYLIMPDHVHFFCSPGRVDSDGDIERWLAYWKRLLNQSHQNPAWRFQSRGWHHRLRQGESYENKWLYVQQNPVRAGLAKTPPD
jgi:putative transposase